uniref:EF-hand domain-containing protein n=1 Tax=Globodera rostochiensis TaxID=31243 RepID=A0A914HN45_GLORO
MRPPSSASSGGHFPAKIDPANRLKCSPLPDRFVTGLRCAFQLLDVESTGRIPYEQICKKWPIHFSEAPVPSNFLECLHRVIPNEEMVTFENFIKGAHLALQERMSTAGRLKRVQSEGKLLGSVCESAHKEESNRPKSRTHSTPGPHPLRSNGHPSMGLSGRKMDGRGDADHRLVRLKRASRSQPQLNEMFDGQKNSTRTLRRTNCLQENKFNFHFADRIGSAVSVKNGNDFKIVYRTKKNKAPPPPEPSNESLNGSDNRRPISAASTVTSTIVPSLSTSRQSSTATFNNGKHLQNSAVHNNCSNNYADELQPQVAKHERLLDEEFDIVKMGTKKAQELMDWFAGRTESLEKRKRMLNKGMVALDSAVHEQKLNFHRAQIAEMNRRIAAFLTSSERGGFPSHSNILNSNSSLTTQPQPQQIRSQVLPPPFPPQSCSSSVPNSSSNCSSSSSSSAASSAPDSNFCTASEAEFLRAQNQKLTKDIQMLAREVEQLRVERHRQPPAVVAAVVPPYQHHQQQKQKMNVLNGAIGHQQHRGRNDYVTMWHSVPIPSSAGFPPFHPPPKDTLL